MISDVVIFLVLTLAQAVPTSHSEEWPKIRYVLPDGFQSWACVDFGVADARALKQDAEGVYELQPLTGVILSTSSLPNLSHAPFPIELMRHLNGQLRHTEFQEFQDR